MAFEIEKYKEYLDDRIKGLKDWLIEQDPNWFKEQKHLDEGTPERIYWHYGELMTLIALRKGLDSPHSKISQIGHWYESSLLGWFLLIIYYNISYDKKD